MTADTYTKSGTKSTSPAKLDKVVFGQQTENHELLKEVYLSYLANGRSAKATTKNRGDVRGGGRKPWRQKGLGRARFGSSRNPIWRGGGVAFGPTGNQNYNRKINQRHRQLAMRQALSLAAAEKRLKVIDILNFSDAKTKSAGAFFKKIEATKNVLLVWSSANEPALRSIRNLSEIKIARPGSLSVFDVMNADAIVIEKEALENLTNRLSTDKSIKKAEVK